MKNLVAQAKAWVTKLWGGLLSYLTLNPKSTSILFILGLVIGSIDTSLGLFILGGYVLFLLYRKGFTQ